MATKSSSKHQTDLYKSYQAGKRFEINRKKKLERTLKAQPNNEQVKNALKNIKYRRRTPKEAKWSHTEKAWAQMKKEFAKPSHTTVKKVDEKKMFSIATRVKDKGWQYWNS